MPYKCDLHREGDYIVERRYFCHDENDAPKVNAKLSTQNEIKEPSETNGLFIDSEENVIVRETGEIIQVEKAITSKLQKQKQKTFRKNARKLSRILNSNFSKEGYFITFTFEDETVTTSQAKKEMNKFMKRLRSWSGLSYIPYVYVVSNKDGKTKQDKRIHIHTVMMCDQFIDSEKPYFHLEVLSKDQKLKTLEQLWKNGTIHAEHLNKAADKYKCFTQKELTSIRSNQTNIDLTRIAFYMLEQAEDCPSTQKWCSAEFMVHENNNVTCEMEYDEILVIPEGFIPIEEEAKEYGPQKTKYKERHIIIENPKLDLDDLIAANTAKINN